jgi:hypothetical protein
MPSHLILFNFITQAILGEEYRSLSSSLCSFLLNTLFSNILSYISPSIWATKFHTHTKQKGPCHQSLVQPQVADWGTASNMEGSCKYIE